ncbi:MAG: methanogenesis marker protein Mmp4/MtxX, partial [Candidatus Hodarchaeota archaeon]
MKIFQKYELLAKTKTPINIGIGLGDSEFHTHKIFTASSDFLRKFKATLWFFGKIDFLTNFLSQAPNSIKNSKVKFIECQDPEESIIKSLNENSIQAVVRGSLSSSKFLKIIKQKLKITLIKRLALLETVNKAQFFYGPVGIDECNNLENKISFIKSALKELHKIEIIPRISILSGGRLGDIGRDFTVNQTIQDADKVIKLIKEKYPNIEISHDEILIESSVEKQSNLIIAPDGISGNLIYRTLVHLGGGKAYGAIYMGLDNTIIDTSRVGDYSEFYGALVLALALNK